MSTLLGIQRRMREVGRIRFGEKRQSKNGKTYPAAIDEIRLTAHESIIRPTADKMREEGETVSAPVPWEKEYEIRTPRVWVAVPPMDQPYSLFYEAWSGGGCTRRCDGSTEFLSGGPCLCNPDDRECKPTLRVNFILRDSPGLGCWRAETKGYNAAAELTAAVDFLALRARQGEILWAVLRVEQRTSKRGGETRNFAVPVLDLPGIGVAELMSGVAMPALPAPARALPEPEPPPLPADPTFNDHKHSDVGTVVLDNFEVTGKYNPAETPPIHEAEPKAVPSNTFFGKAKAINPDMDAIRAAVKAVRGVESTKGITELEAQLVYERLEGGGPDTMEQIAADVFGPGVEVVAEDPHA